jgi:hypothetical protein
MNKINLITLLAFAVPMVSVNAAWQLVDDFSDGDTAGWYTYTQNTTAEPGIFVENDPMNTNLVIENTDNKVLAAYPRNLAAPFESSCNLYAVKTLPIDTTENGFERGKVGTLYFRTGVKTAYVDEGGVIVPYSPVVDNAIGTLTKTAEYYTTPTGTDPVTGEPIYPTAPGYGVFAAILRMYEYDNSLDIYDTTYQVIRDTQLQVDNWYEIFYVNDRTLANYINDTFNVYIRGPLGSEYPVTTKIYTPVPPVADPAKAGAYYRVRQEASHPSFAMGLSAGNPVGTSPLVKGLDPSYFDDFYVNYGSGVPVSPCGIYGCPAGIKDTHLGEVWDGWAPYIYMYGSSNWVYVYENQTDEAYWAYSYAEGDFIWTSGYYGTWYYSYKDATWKQM